MLRTKYDAGKEDAFNFCLETTSILDVKTRLDFDAEGVSAHAVASLLKLYIRQLPEPLLPFRYYTTLLKVNSKYFYHVFLPSDA